MRLTNGKSSGKARVQQQPSERRLDEHLARTVACRTRATRCSAGCRPRAARGKCSTANLPTGIRTLILACNAIGLAVATEPLFVRGERLVDRAEHAALTGQTVERLRQVVEADDHVLARHRDRTTRRRRQDVVRGEHQHARLGLRLRGERKVHGHLVTVEVGVERRADERVDLDRLALDEHGLEGLDAEAVKRWSTVQEDRVLLDDLFEHVPHLRAGALDHALGRLDVLRVLEVDEPLHDEGLEELERHLLRQTALLQAQLRTDDDDRTTRVVDALAEQVLTEPALLALQHVGEATSARGCRDP